jgi:hypothetical protein
MPLRGIHEASAMNATQMRDMVFRIAGTENDAALKVANTIKDPWFRAQSLAAVAETCPRHRAPQVAEMAFAAASKGPDTYSRSAVRAWPIRALLAQGYEDLAKQELQIARQLATSGDVLGSQGESLITLWGAASTLDAAAQRPFLTDLARLETQCNHWRIRRALVHAIGHVHPDDRVLAAKLAIAIQDTRTRRRALERLAQR